MSNTRPTLASGKRAFVKAYLPKSDVNKIKREAAKKRVSASSYVAQIVLDHLASIKESRQ
jgi:N-glycosylase/DNA lyase